MQKLKERVGATGLQIPKTVLEEYGIPEGASVVIEVEEKMIRIVPEQLTEGVIKKLALNYVLNHVGDATAIGKPKFEDKNWIVPVVLPYKKIQLGTLVFSETGMLLNSVSTAPEEMLRKASET